MQDLHQFALLLSDVAPAVELIDGRVFLDRFNVGIDGLREKIAAHATPEDAQKWINLVPVDDLIDLAVSDWSMDDPSIEGLAAIFRTSWLAIICSKYGHIDGLSLEVLKDREYGDVLFRLAQS